jgi:hypothetical protein
MENDEIGMTKNKINPNHEIALGLLHFGTLSEFAEAVSEHSGLVIPSSFVIRISSFLSYQCNPCNPWFSSSNYGESNRVA